MKIYSEFQTTESNGRRVIHIWPQSISPKYKSTFVLLANELHLNEKNQLNNGQEISLGLVGKDKKSYMLFPPSKKDNRVLLIFSFPSPKHRQDGFILESICSYKEHNLLFHTSGSGAWGAGVAGMVILEDGEHIGSNCLTVYKNIGGELVTKSFNNIAEAQMWLGILKDDDVEML